MKSPTTNQPSPPRWRTRAAWLTAIPALIILCLAAVPQPQSSPGYIDNNAPQLEGSWLVTVTLGPGGGSPFESPVSFTADGVMIGSQPSYPDYLFTPWHGAWAKKGHRQFAYTAIAFYWDNTIEGLGLWKVILKETLTIERGGDAYNSTSSTVEGFGPDGAHWGPSEGDTTHAIRIKAE